jgi:mannobiose 2-epimerase
MHDQDWAQRFEAELTGNILPFWMQHAVDHENGGFYGALSNDLKIDNQVPRSAILCARVLWTYATAQRLFPSGDHLKMARHAYDYLTQRFWDKEHGGVYWMLDAQGRPVNDRKHAYAQAFAVYALSEFYRATQEPESLRLAQQLFGLIETHTHDRVHGGNIEGCGRTWNQLADLRLSEKEPDCRKSMNTMLHVMEAYTNLLRVWDTPELRSTLDGILRVHLDHIIDLRSGHLRLFFDDEWRSVSGVETYGHEISYGHDIEASWLLVEAAEVLGDKELLRRSQAAALKIAETVLAEGQYRDGRLLAAPADEHGAEVEWWVPAEAVVGFYNAYQLSSQPRFAEASRSNWDFIEAKLVDRTHGDWYKRLDRAGVPIATSHKIGPWECPYHHSRCCFEMLARLKA